MATKNTIPNLDEMALTKLAKFYRSMVKTTDRKVKDLLGGNTIEDERNFVKLRQYAASKCSAIVARHEGMIAFALKEEERCDAIYETLPAKARW